MIPPCIYSFHSGYEVRMNTFNPLPTPRTQQLSPADSRCNPSSNDGITMSVYAILLRAPLMRIAGNVSNRPDISSAAILGYN